MTSVLESFCEGKNFQYTCPVSADARGVSLCPGRCGLEICILLDTFAVAKYYRKRVLYVKHLIVHNKLKKMYFASLAL